MGQVFFCPRCKNILEEMNYQYFCQNCAHSYFIVNGIPSFVDRKATIGSFDASVFAFLFEMEQRHFWHIGRKEIILDALKRNIPGLATCNMLEIGCGNGSVLAYLKQNGINIEGGDIFLEGLKFCQKGVSSAVLYQIDILSLPFVNNFDIVGLFDILEHIDEDEKALLQISQALKPGGKILLTVPAHKILWSHFDELSKHKRRYSRRELIAKLQRNGFVIKKISFYMFFLLPLLVAVRLLSNTVPGMRGGNNIKTSVEVKTIPILNEVFLWLLRLEKQVIRHLTLPFGASLLVLAEKKQES